MDGAVRWQQACLLLSTLALFALSNQCSAAAATTKRLKRQTLPSNHVQVHSIDSNVSVTDVVVVTSSHSRIELRENQLNMTTWASSSNVTFDSYDTFVNYTASDVETYMHVRTANVHAQSVTSKYSMYTNRSSDGQSSSSNALRGSVNVSIEDSGMKVEAFQGSSADLTAYTRHINARKMMDIASNVTDKTTLERQIILSTSDNDYFVRAVLLGARVRTVYGEVMLDIDPDYRRVRLFTQTHTVELRTVLSPFQLALTDQHLIIVTPKENTRAVIEKNSSDVFFDVQQHSLLQVDHGGGDIAIGGRSTQAERLNVTSLSLKMALYSTREMSAQSTTSHISIATNSTTASLTSSHHALHVLNGVPSMLLETGNVTIDMTTTPSRPVAPTLFPPFALPPDRFVTVGPPEFVANHEGTPETIEGSGETPGTWRTSPSGGPSTGPGGSTDDGNLLSPGRATSGSSADSTVAYRTQATSKTSGGVSNATTGATQGGRTGGGASMPTTVAPPPFPTDEPGSGTATRFPTPANSLPGFMTDVWSGSTDLTETPPLPPTFPIDDTFTLFPPSPSPLVDSELPTPPSIPPFEIVPAPSTVSTTRNGFMVAQYGTTDAFRGRGLEIGAQITNVSLPQQQEQQSPPAWHPPTPLTAFQELPETGALQGSGASRKERSAQSSPLLLPAVVLIGRLNH